MYSLTMTHNPIPHSSFHFGVLIYPQMVILRIWSYIKALHPCLTSILKFWFCYWQKVWRVVFLAWDRALGHLEKLRACNIAIFHHYTFCFEEMCQIFGVDHINLGLAWNWDGRHSIATWRLINNYSSHPCLSCTPLWHVSQMLCLQEQMYCYNVISYFKVYTGGLVITPISKMQKKKLQSTRSAHWLKQLIQWDNYESWLE